MFLRLVAAVCLGLAFVTPARAQTLEPERLPGMCLTIDPQQGSISRPCDIGGAQDFVLPDGGPGPIRLGEQCLAPRGGGNYPALFAEACSGAPAQTWTVSEEGIVANGDDRCLALLGLSSRDGEVIYAAECRNREWAQRWRVLPNNRYDYEPVRGRIHWQPDASLCLSWIEQGSFIGLAECGAVGDQIFSFDMSDPGQVRMRASCLGSNVGGSVRLGRCAVAPDTIWFFQNGATLSDGAPACMEPQRESERWVIRMRACTAQAEQRWDFEAVEN